MLSRLPQECLRQGHAQAGFLLLAPARAIRPIFKLNACLTE